MLPRSRLLVCLPLLLAACSKPADPVTPPRAVLRGEGETYSVVPTAGQLPFCLVIEVQETAARSLVAGEDGQSVDCDAGKVLGPWKLPAKNDPFRALVVFSDKKLRGDTVALQIREQLTQNPKVPVSSMDLRAPGQITIEALEVRPAEIRPPK